VAFWELVLRVWAACELPLSRARLGSVGRKARGLAVESEGQLGCWSAGLSDISRCCLVSRLRGQVKDDDRSLLVE